MQGRYCFSPSKRQRALECSSPVLTTFQSTACSPAVLVGVSRAAFLESSRALCSSKEGAALPPANPVSRNLSSDRIRKGVRD